MPIVKRIFTILNPGLVIIENTQNACGGIPLSLEYMHAVGDLVHQFGN